MLNAVFLCFCYAGDLKGFPSKAYNPSTPDWASRVAQLVKNPPANAGGVIRSLIWKDPLEEEIAIYSSFLAWRIQW